MRQVVLLQYVDGPVIELAELWVRVLLAADGPETRPAGLAFEQEHEAAVEQLAGALPANSARSGWPSSPARKPPTAAATARASTGCSERLAAARGWELGGRTQVDMHATLGRSGLKR